MARTGERALGPAWRPQAGVPPRGSQPAGGGGLLIMRVSSSFLSNTNTQAGEDIKYAAGLSL